MTGMHHITDPAMFERFHKALTSERVEYTPWYFLLSKGLKDPVAGISWKQLEGRLTFEQALKKMRSGYNIGIAATAMDPLCIVDVDDITTTPDEIVKPTLSTRSRKRIGRHYFYFTEDPRCKEILITEGKGEIRSRNEYVVAPGSFVICDQKTMDAMPESEKVNAGRYTIENERAPDTITFEEFPPVFLEQARKNREAEAEKKRKRKIKEQARKDKKPVQRNDKNQSAMWDLSIEDIMSIPNKKRFKSLFHESTTGKNTSLNDDGGLTCWRHLCTHTPLSALAVMAGVADCNSAGQGINGRGSSCIDYTDGATLFKMWAFAKQEGMIPEEDPIPAAALRYYAVDQGLCKEGDIKDGWKLPMGVYQRTLKLIENKEEVSTGRATIAAPTKSILPKSSIPTKSISHSECFECSEEMYLKIVNEILKERKADRKFTTIFQLVKPMFLTTKTPSYTELFNGTSPYSEKSIRVQRSRLKKAGIIDEDGLFTLSFFNDYVRKFNEKRTIKERLDAIKKDSRYFEDITVELGFDYENTMDVIRMNPTVMYHLPELPVKKLDYFDTYNIQIIKMNHVGGNPVVQLPLSYHYRCGACGYETDLAFDVKSLPCNNTEGCKGGTMGRVKSQDIIRPAFASRVVTDDLNSISIISLSEIPQGEFIGAVFLCRNKADYHLFMIATEEIEPSSSTVTITPDRHAIWQLVDMIDQQHEDRIGTHIHGMDWYKAAILMSYLANCKGRVSTNCLIVGDPGVGKTSTPRFYIATLTPQQKVIDAMQLTGPGLHGSMAQIKIGDSTINVPEAGLLVRHRLVVIDELLENRNSLMPQLKSALMSSTISREVAGNRTQTPKYATAIATSNPVPAVIMAQIKWMNEWLMADGGVATSIFEGHPAKDAMIEEWTLRGLEWRTGQPMADMDRYPLIFFVRDPSDEVSDFDLGGEDMEIDDLRLAKLLYDSDINEYFSFCGRLKVDWKSQNVRIIELVRELRKRDKIHSKKRLGQNITLMLQLSAQINGRCDLTDEDFDFVRELWSKTCDWIDVSQLSHESSDKTYPTTEWNIERIKKAIHEGMKEYKGSQKYYQTPRGFAMIADKLEAQGAPVGLVEDTIERFKQNPDQ